MATGFVGLGYRIWKRAASVSCGVVLAFTAGIAALVAIVLLFVGAR